MLTHEQRLAMLDTPSWPIDIIIDSDTFNEILGNLNIAKGNYPQAQQNLAKTQTNSAALAHILNKDYAAAQKTLAAINSAEPAELFKRSVIQDVVLQ